MAVEKHEIGILAREKFLMCKQEIYLHQWRDMWKVKLFLDVSAFVIDEELRTELRNSFNFQQY